VRAGPVARCGARPGPGGTGEWGPVWDRAAVDRYL
jgi:hypothetical protein